MKPPGKLGERAGLVEDCVTEMVRSTGSVSSSKAISALNCPSGGPRLFSTG
jgi:hypothetical protein